MSKLHERVMCECLPETMGACTVHLTTLKSTMTWIVLAIVLVGGAMPTCESLRASCLPTASGVEREPSFPSSCGRIRQALLLPRSGRFIAFGDRFVLSLHCSGDGSWIRGFMASSEIVTDIDVTADESRLLGAFNNGEIDVWSIDTGKRLWWHAPDQSGLGIYDASFSRDGKSVIACDWSNFVVIFDALTGSLIRKIEFTTQPEMQITSAALSPDGSNGACCDMANHLYTFDVQSGQIRDTKLMGSSPMTYSADGKYIAMCTRDETDHIRIVVVQDLSVMDVGCFDWIGPIRSTEDGKFLASGNINGSRGSMYAVVGVIVDPVSMKLTESWRLPYEVGQTVARKNTDFDPDNMVGVSACGLTTTLFDLRSGSALYTIYGDSAGAGPDDARRR
jgi:hypothetical protein